MQLVLQQFHFSNDFRTIIILFAISFVGLSVLFWKLDKTFQISKK